MARWPNVPDLYGWLKLDARGNFRVRTAGSDADAHFDTIGNPRLRAFIGRNYQRDPRGCWLFQNGPQRVFVELEATPWVYRLDAAGALSSHTGVPATVLRAVLMDEAATPLCVTDLGPGVVDDRDLDAFLRQLVGPDGNPVVDDSLDAWLADRSAREMWFAAPGERIRIEPIRRAALAERFGFVPAPEPPAAGRDAAC